MFLFVFFIIPLVFYAPKFAYPTSSEEKIQAEKKKVANLSSEEDKLLTDLVSFESSIERKQKEIELLDNEINTLNNQLIPLNNKVNKANKALQESQTALNNRVVNMYKYGNTNPFEIIFSAKNLSDLLNRFAYLKLISENDHQLLIQNKANKLILHKMRQDLISKKNELVLAKEEQEKAQDSLVQNKNDKNLLLDKIQNEKDNSLDLINKLEEEATVIKARMNQIQAPSRGESIGTVRGKLRMYATAYCPNCGGGNGRTASGLKAGHGVVAVDPSVIPLGTRLNIYGYGQAVAGDTGSLINGHRIDLGFNTHAEVLAYGTKWVTVEIID